MKKIFLTLAVMIIAQFSYAQFSSSGSNTTTSDNVGIGTTSPQSLLSVNGGAAIGTYAGSNAAPNNSLIVSGAIGIGTSSPSGRLEVASGPIIASGFSNRPSGTGPALEIGYDGNQTVLQSYDRTTSTLIPAFFGASRYNFNGGNVGIGTTSPKGLLSLGDQSTVVETSGITLGGTQSSVEFVGSTYGLGYGHKIYATDPSNGAVDLRFAVRQGATSWTDALTIRSNTGNIGVGTTTPGSKLDINGTVRLGGGIDYGSTTVVSAAPGTIAFDAPGDPGGRFYISGSTGNVLIGKTSQTNTAYKLDVNGSVRANEVVVNTTGADFVFKPTYNLPKLSEVKTYIDINHHLPEIPSAEQMKKDGMSVSEMNTKLLQKVEELTLYLIDKDKQLSSQQKEIEQLKRQQKKSEQEGTRIAVLERALVKLTNKTN